MSFRSEETNVTLQQDFPACFITLHGVLTSTTQVSAIFGNSG